MQIKEFRLEEGGAFGHLHDQSQIGSQVTKLFPMLAFLTLIVLVLKKNVYFAACGLIMFIFFSEYLKRSLKI